MYILKTKGTAKIPDYVQLRDSNFVLSSHFTVSDMANVLTRNDLAKFKEKLSEIINKLPYGELQELDL